VSRSEKNNPSQRNDSGSRSGRTSHQERGNGRRR